jgi:hypothetical protein
VNRFENLMRPCVPLFVEGAIFTGFCTLASFLTGPDRINYIGPKLAAITGSTAWMGFVATQKVAEVVIKQFAEQYVSKSKYFTVPFSLMIGFSLASSVLMKLKPRPDKNLEEQDDVAKMDGLSRILTLGIIYNGTFKQLVLLQKTAMKFFRGV